eukprot:COSAG02_NODE_1601_length_11741_cov_40.329411_2_plen_173_part_00
MFVIASRQTKASRGPSQRRPRSRDVRWGLRPQPPAAAHSEAHERKVSRDTTKSAPSQACICQTTRSVLYEQVNQVGEGSRAPFLPIPWLVRENTSCKRPKTRFLAATRKEGVKRHHTTAPSPLRHKPPTTRVPQRRTIRRDPAPARAHTRRQQAPRGPAARGSPSSLATKRR